MIVPASLSLITYCRINPFWCSNGTGSHERDADRAVIAVTVKFAGGELGAERVNGKVMNCDGIATS